VAPEDYHCIPSTQRNLHVGSELLAVGLVAPLLMGVALGDARLDKNERAFLFAVGAGTLLLDGYLLFKFLRRAAPTGPGA